MAVTENTYTGDGSTVLFSFTFPYLDQSHVKVSLNGSDTTAFTFANATTVQLNSAPAVGVAVRVYRNSDQDNVEATFFPGSAIRATDLNENFLQSLYLNQETRRIAQDATTGAIADGSISSAKLGSEVVTEPKIGPAAVTESKIGTGAVTETKLGAGSVTNSKIAAGAVQATQLATDAVTNAKIATGAVNTDELASSAVTEAKVGLTNLLNYVYLTTPGSGTYTPTAGTKRILVEVWGGGGGGGAVDGQGAGTWAKGGPGGGGGYCCKWIASGLAASYSYTVGAGGAGGAAGANDGGTGGTSTFSGTGVNLSATGGAGGVGATGSATGSQPSGASGGTATGGDLNIRGGTGESISNQSALLRTGTPGAGYSFPQSNWTAGVGSSTGSTGQDAFNPAEGGAGGLTRGIATNYAGGAGGPGLIKITEYFV